MNVFLIVYVVNILKLRSKYGNIIMSNYVINSNIWLCNSMYSLFIVGDEFLDFMLSHSHLSMHCVLILLNFMKLTILYLLTQRQLC